MGMFDEVHAGHRHGQTKALGKGGGWFLPGSAAQIIPAPMSDTEFEQYLTGGLDPVADSAQIAMHEGGFVTLRDGVLIEWTDVRDEQLPLFNSLGQPLADEQLSDGYLYASRHLTVTVDGQSARLAEDELLDRLFGPADPAEQDRRDAERRAEAVGEPGDCDLCAQVRDGRAGQLIAERDALIESRRRWNARYAELAAADLDEQTVLARLGELRALSRRDVPLSDTDRFRLAELTTWKNEHDRTAAAVRTQVEAELGPWPGTHL